MITVVSVLEVYPGREKDWHEVWRQIRAAHGTTEGFRAARLFHDMDHPERYVVLEEWEDRRHYDSFARQVGAPWLLGEWKIGPPLLLGLVVLQEES